MACRHGEIVAQTEMYEMKQTQFLNERLRIENETMK